MNKHRKLSNGSFAKRLQYLIDLKKIGQIDVAKGISVDRSRISLWLNGKVVGPRRATLQKLSDFFGCNIDWLAEGTGEPFQTAQKNTTEEQQFHQSQQDETFSMKEMVSMAIEILESETDYKSALATNIRAFHQAVTMENEMKHVQKELVRMENRMERMEQMLFSLGATLPEKRDKAANS